MAKPKFLPLLCPVVRTKTVTVSSLNILSGETGPSRTETRTEPCGAPLFGKDREVGKCRQCAEGR